MLSAGRRVRPRNLQIRATMVLVARLETAAVSPLLSVKHLAPPTRHSSVARPRLIDRLDAIDTPLSVVVAPAGWGKTTLLAQWVEHLGPDRRVAWLSLDESDNEPARFWSYVLDALVSTTGVGWVAAQALSAPSADPVGLVLPLLINELADLPDPVLLILDDYHLISDRSVHEGVEFLLSYLPSSFRLVLATRADPALPLARLRARQQLSELRGDDLRFNAGESASLLASVSQVELSDTTVAGLWQRTEGWAAGLQLAGLALRGAARPTEAASELHGTDRHIVDYLSEEVLARTDPVNRDFLVRTSVLEQLSGPLCDAVLQRSGSGDVLIELERLNLFLTPLDRRRQWYRCHGLFREVLRRELEQRQADLVPGLLDRGASWYAQQEEIEQAVRLRLAGGEAGAAMALLRAEEEWFFERGAASSFLELGEQTAALGATDPQVFLMLAYAAALCGRFGRTIIWCNAAERCLDGTTHIDGWHSALASVLSMRAAYGHVGDGEVAAALTDARKAVQLETDAAMPGYVVCRVALGSALMRLDRFEQAAVVLTDAWQRPARELLPTPALLQAAGLFGLALLRRDRHDEAVAILHEVARRANDVEAAWGDGAAAALTWLRLVEGRIAYRSHDLTAATRILSRAVSLADLWGRGTELVMALSSLAEAQLAAGDGAAARESLTRARDCCDQEPVRRSAIVELEAVETRIGRGAVRAARRQGRLHEELTDRELSVLRALPGPATSREIGDALFLSVNTVKGYTKSLYRKLGAASRAEAVQQGHALGLI